MFIICGDTHGTFDLGKVDKFFYEHRGEFSEYDYLRACLKSEIYEFLSIIFLITRKKDAGILSYVKSF